jgi:hypothetical protein
MAKSFFTILSALVMALSMWIWVQKIAIPHQQAESTERGVPRGNLSDIYPRWLGARELLLRHRDPYGDDITREIQAGYYGRVLDPARPTDPKDQQAFAYPVYVVLLLAPTVGMPFNAAHAIFFWSFILLTAMSVLVWLHALDWRISGTALCVWILLTLSCFPVIQGIKLQQLSLLVAALIAGFMYALARRHFVVAGTLLAIASIKPQLVALPILWLCIWVVGDWRNRQRALWSFVISVAVLFVAGEVLLPGWVHEFRAALAAYYQYTGGGKSILDVALTPIFGRLISAFLIGTLAVMTWRIRRADEQSAEFQWSFMLALAVTLAVIPMFAPYNQILLLPGMMVIARSLRALWSKNYLSRIFVVLTFVAVSFQWIAAVALVIASLFLPVQNVQKAWGLPFYLTFAAPIMILALLLFMRGVLVTNSFDPSASI